MHFTSPFYYIFLLVLYLLFLIARTGKYQKFLLVLGSVVFCLSFSWLSFLVVSFCGIVNYALLLQLHRSSDKKSRATIYYSGLALNILILFIYKLLQVVSIKANESAGFVNDYLVMLGLGFYVLQIIGYYIEIYKRKAAFTLSFFDFYLSLFFFAKLPEGPILQMKQAFQITSGYDTSWKHNLSYAIQRILLGVFKKVALADRLGYYVQLVFDENSYLNGLTIYLAALLFTFQLYFDFSGFIDIAIGSARLFGIHLPENFNLPLRAKSITEFWRRWHISLVSWLSQYVFYPFSFRFRKYKKWGLVVAIVITFFISAAWHGLAITFFIWALCHVLYIILEHWLGRRKMYSGIWMKLGNVILVWHLVSFANLFFRSASLGSVAKLFSDFTQLPFLYKEGINFKTWLINGGQDIENEFNYRLSILLCLLFLVFEKKMNRFATSENYNVFFVAFMIVLIAVFGMFNTGQHFIYSQF